MSSTSGESCPGSASDGKSDPISSAATTRGEILDAAVDKAVELDTDTCACALVSGESQTGLSKPTMENYPVMGPEDILRTKILYGLGGLIGTLVLLGLIATTWLAIVGVPGNAPLEYLKTAFSYFSPLVTLVVGYYFGQRGERVAPVK